VGGESGGHSSRRRSRKLSVNAAGSLLTQRWRGPDSKPRSLQKKAPSKRIQRPLFLVIPPEGRRFESPAPVGSPLRTSPFGGENPSMTIRIALSTALYVREETSRAEDHRDDIRVAPVFADNLVRPEEARSFIPNSRGETDSAAEERGSNYQSPVACISAASCLWRRSTGHADSPYWSSFCAEGRYQR
jgi:hypothetical protein